MHNSETFTIAVLSARMSADPAYDDQSERILLSAELTRGLPWVCAERFNSMAEAIYRTFVDSPICPPEGREYWDEYADAVEKSKVDPWRLGSNYEEWWALNMQGRWREDIHFVVNKRMDNYPYAFVCPNDFGQTRDEKYASRKTPGALSWYISDNMPFVEPKTVFVLSRPFQLVRDDFGRIIFM